MTSSLAYIGYLVVVIGLINLARIVLLMVGSDLYKVRQTLSKQPIPLSSLPTFSVVIPAHNEAHTLARAIASIAYARYDKAKLQIIVVDDGSTDDTHAIAERYKKEHGLTHMLVLTQANAGKAHALNYGLREHATGELVMCLDADSFIAPDALLNAARYFRDARVVALASNVKIRLTGTFLNIVQAYEYMVCYQMKRAQTFFNMEYIIGGIGSTFRRSALEAVDFYDTDTITEDIDLTMKLLRLGNRHHRVMYGSDVITYTESVLSIRDLMRQRFRWKYGRNQTFLKNTSLFFATHERYSKTLTFFYLPYALISDVLFFLEPLVLAYIATIIFIYHDWAALASAIIVIGSYIALNALAEDTLSWKARALYALAAPSMYLFFYVLSFVEYTALIRTYASYAFTGARRRGGGGAWTHVERPQLN